jgi:hypothetical protein
MRKPGAAGPTGLHATPGRSTGARTTRSTRRQCPRHTPARRKVGGRPSAFSLFWRREHTWDARKCQCGTGFIPPDRKVEPPRKMCQPGRRHEAVPVFSHADTAAATMPGRLEITLSNNAYLFYCSELRLHCQDDVPVLDLSPGLGSRSLRFRLLSQVRRRTDGQRLRDLRPSGRSPSAGLTATAGTVPVTAPLVV